MFQDALIESIPHRGSIGIGLPLSILVHALSIAVVIVFSLRAFEESPEPAMPIVFPHLGTPPPLGDSGANAATVPQRRDRNEQAHVVRQPEAPEIVRDLKEMLSSSNEQPAATSEQSDLSATGGREGDSRGLDGGTGTDIAAAGEAPIPVGGDVRPPRLLERVEPDYPEPARRIRAEGVVILEAIISATGSVEDVRVLRSASPFLAAAAHSAVERWRYEPATLNGRPVKVFLTVTVVFKLH